jgi:hypothetical protein
MMNLWRRLQDEAGFALAMAVFALVLLAAVVAGGYFSASQEFQIGRGMRNVTTSFYAGEAGILQVLDQWDAGAYSTLQPGDTNTVGPITFEGGGSYTASVVRVGTDSVKSYYYIEAVGRPPGPNQGQRPARGSPTSVAMRRSRSSRTSTSAAARSPSSPA